MREIEFRGKTVDNEWIYGNEDLYIVKYEDCSFVIEDKWGGRINQDQDSIYRLECEIVGNICDNPELLGE